MLAAVRRRLHLQDLLSLGGAREIRNQWLSERVERQMPNQCRPTALEVATPKPSHSTQHPFKAVSAGMELTCQPERAGVQVVVDG